MTDRPPVPPGWGLRIGLLLVALGVLAVLVAVLPFFFGATDRPLWLNLSCLLLPVGLVVATWSVVARGRREQRDVAREYRSRR